LIEPPPPSFVDRAHPSATRPPLFGLAAWHGCAAPPAPVGFGPLLAGEPRAGRGGAHPLSQPTPTAWHHTTNPSPHLQTLHLKWTPSSRRPPPPPFLGFPSPAMQAHPCSPLASRPAPVATPPLPSPHFPNRSPPLSAFSVSSTKDAPFTRLGRTSPPPSLTPHRRGSLPPLGSIGESLPSTKSFAPPTVATSLLPEHSGKPQSARACPVQPPPLPEPRHRRRAERGDRAGRRRERTRGCAEAAPWSCRPRQASGRKMVWHCA
jgi:hypothetical protein